MNGPDWMFWRHLLSILGIEICAVAALGFAAQRFIASAAVRRLVWQLTVVCLLLLPFSEWTGLGRGAANFLVGQKPAAKSAVVSGSTTFNVAPIVLPLVPLPSPTSQRVVWWPGWLWLAGAALVLGRISLAQALLAGLRLTREKIADSPLRERIALAAQRVGLRRKVRALWMPKSMSPMAFGIFWPCLGLPPGFQKFSATEQDAILAHELAHIAAWDPFWFLLADLAGAALWWHPAVWWVRRSLHGAAELAADDAATLVPQGPDALARCLVSLAREMTAARGWGWAGISGDFDSNLGKRVERLTQMSGNARRPLAAWAVVAGVCAIPVMLLLAASLQAAPAQTTGTLRDELRDSWDNSPGARLLLATAETDQTNNGQNQMADVAKQIANAKLLYEMGKYKEAEGVFDQVLKAFPTNANALYYQHLIAASRQTLHGQLSLATNAYPAGYDPSTNLYTKVFMIDSVAFSHAMDVASNAADTTFGQRGDGLTQYFLGIGVDLSPPKNVFFNVGLGELLVRASQKDLATIEQALALLNSSSSAQASNLPPPLFTRVYKVDPAVFLRAMGVASNAANTTWWRLEYDIRKYFLGMGVDISPPKNVFFNDRLGELLVRASQQDLATIEQALASLNVAPQQVMMAATFVEMSAAEAKSLGIRLIDDTRGKVVVVEPRFFTPAEYKAAMKAMYHADAVILSAPKITTLSGRQACVGSDSDGDKMMFNVTPTVKTDGSLIEAGMLSTILKGSKSWQVGATQSIPDGCTYVMGRSVDDSSSGQGKIRLVFVTAQVIDAAGNPVHPRQ